MAIDNPALPLDRYFEHNAAKIMRPPTLSLSLLRDLGFRLQHQAVVKSPFVESSGTSLRKSTSEGLGPV